MGRPRRAHGDVGFGSASADSAQLNVTQTEHRITTRRVVDRASTDLDGLRGIIRPQGNHPGACLDVPAGAAELHVVGNQCDVGVGDTRVGDIDATRREVKQLVGTLHGQIDRATLRGDVGRRYPEVARGLRQTDGVVAAVHANDAIHRHHRQGAAGCVADRDRAVVGRGRQVGGRRGHANRARTTRYQRNAGVGDDVGTTADARARGDVQSRCMGRCNRRRDCYRAAAGVTHAQRSRRHRVEFA